MLPDESIIGAVQWKWYASFTVIASPPDSCTDCNWWCLCIYQRPMHIVVDNAYDRLEDLYTSWLTRLMRLLPLCMRCSIVLRYYWNYTSLQDMQPFQFGRAILVEMKNIGTCREKNKDSSDVNVEYMFIWSIFIIQLVSQLAFVSRHDTAKCLQKTQLEIMYSICQR